MIERIANNFYVDVDRIEAMHKVGDSWRIRIGGEWWNLPTETAARITKAAERGFRDRCMSYLTKSFRDMGVETDYFKAYALICDWLGYDPYQDGDDPCSGFQWETSDVSKD